MEHKTLPARLSRSLSIERRAIDDAARTCELAFSSETPYERTWGIEVLGHAEGEIDLSRLLATRPLLRDHDPEKLIGTIESVTVGADRIARATVRFGKTQEADDAWNLVQDGILRNVSVGYMINEMAMVAQDGDCCTYRVTSWTPYEISMVSIPADAAVGVGRALEERDTTVVVVIAGCEEDEDEVDAMPEAETDVPAVDASSTPVADIYVEAACKPKEKSMSHETLAAELFGVAEQFRHLGAMDKVGEFIRAGKSVAEFQSAILAGVENKPSAPAAEIGLTGKEQKSYSVMRLMRALADPSDKQAQAAAAFELECHRAVADKIGESKRGGVYLPFEVQKRDLSNAANGGGYLVGTANLGGSFIEMLRNSTRVIELGARTMSGLQGNVTIPKQTASATAYWLANETTAITESQQTIGQLSLSPKNVGAYTEVSRQLMVQSSPDAEQIVMADLAAVLARAVDLAALNGSGGSGQPQGLIGTAGVGSVSGTSLGYAGVVEFQTDVAGNNALASNAAYLTTPTVAGLLMQRFTNTTYGERPLWDGSVLDGRMAGFRAAASANVPTGYAIFGDFSQIIIADWGVVELATNPYANFAAGITGVRAWATVDVGVRQAGAFSVASSVT